MRAQSTRSSLWPLLWPIALLCMLVHGFAAAADATSDQRNTSRVILSLDEVVNQQSITRTLTKLRRQRHDRSIASNHVCNSMVVSIQHPNLSSQQLQHELQKVPGIMAVSKDAKVSVTATVDDPRFEEQWQLHTPDQFLASLDTVRAWDITHGSAEVVVAVIDTGIDYNHPDLEGRILPGYDLCLFIESVG